MYSVKEIKVLLKNCNSMEESLKVCKHLKDLQQYGQCIKHLQCIALQRVLEI